MHLKAGAYLCAWGTDVNNVWVVGGQPERGVVWHRQNDVFREVDVPSGALLNWTHGHGAAQWIVGNQGRILHRPIQAHHGAPNRVESTHHSGVCGHLMAMLPLLLAGMRWIWGRPTRSFS